MSTRGALTVTKKLVGDCEIDNEIDPGDTIEYSLVIQNDSSVPQTISIFDAINIVTMESFSWIGIDIGAAATSGSAAAGTDLIDETLELEPCAIFEYTITVETKNPFCGSVTNCVRYCQPSDKRPTYLSSPPVYVGLLEEEACLSHDSTNLNDALWEFMPSKGRAAKFFDFIEAGYDLVDVLEVVSKLLVDSDTAKPLNEDWEGFAELEAVKKAKADAVAAAVARRDAAIAEANPEAEATE